MPICGFIIPAGYGRRFFNHVSIGAENQPYRLWLYRHVGDEFRGSVKRQDLLPLISAQQ
jgi:hypothetical protein